MGEMGCYKKNVYHVGKHSRPTPRLAHVIIYLVIHYIFHLFRDRSSFKRVLPCFRYFSLVFQYILEYMLSKCGQRPSSRVAIVG